MATPEAMFAGFLIVIRKCASLKYISSSLDTILDYHPQIRSERAPVRHDHATSTGRPHAHPHAGRSRLVTGVVISVASSTTRRSEVDRRAGVLCA